MKALEVTIFRLDLNGSYTAAHKLSVTQINTFVLWFPPLISESGRHLYLTVLEIRNPI